MQWNGCFSRQVASTELLKPVSRSVSSEASGPPLLDHVHLATSAARAAFGIRLIAAAAAAVCADGSTACARPAALSVMPSWNATAPLSLTLSSPLVGSYSTSNPP